MKATPLSIVLVSLVTASCSSAPADEVVEPTGADTAELMAIALAHLVAEDHTFGDGPPPFSEYLIEEATVDVDAFISSDGEATGGVIRPLTTVERQAVEAAITVFGPVSWVADPGEWQGDDLEPVVEGAAILGVGVPTSHGGVFLVPVSLWCGGTCGTWFKYRLSVVDGEWRVVGIDGPVAIS